MRKIKKYFVIILLSIFTLTTVETSSLNFSVYIVQAKASSSTKRKAQEAYRKFLTQRRYRYFTLWDIDKDGLKELLVTDGREQVGNSPTKAYAYTYTRGKLRYAEVNSMTDTEYRERCRELEENIHMLESEVNVLNNECERLSNLKEKSRNSLQMSSLENNPIFVEKAQVDMEKELPTIGKSQDKKNEDKPEISQGTGAQINQFCPYCGAVVKGMRFCGQCGKRVN